MSGAHRRSIAAVALFFAGCVLPDYEKVDEPSGGATAPAPEQSASEPCCGGVACEDPDVLDCTCASDSFCCEEGWDAACAAAMEDLGCRECTGEPVDPDSEEAPQQSCDDDGVCGEETPVCVGGLCAQCGQDADCASAFPEMPVCIEGACGECHDDADCQSLYGEEAPICDAGLCAGCANDADCPDGDTCSDGYCQ